MAHYWAKASPYYHHFFLSYLLKSCFYKVQNQLRVRNCDNFPTIFRDSSCRPEEIFFKKITSKYLTDNRTVSPD